MWLIGVEVEQETSAPHPKNNPGSAPVLPPHSKVHGAHSFISAEQVLQAVC